MDEGYWLAQWLKLDAANRAVWESETEPPDGGVLCWRDARSAMPAYLDMYEADGDTQYLDVFVKRANQILEYAAITDGYPGWSSSRYSAVPEEGPAHDFAIAGTLMRFANLAAGMPRYESSATLCRVVGAQVAKKWADSWRQIDESAGVYVRNGRSFPNNQLALAGIFHWENGDTDRAQMLAESIRRAMRPHPILPGGVIWDYANEMLPGAQQPSNVRVDDINHAGQVASFVALAIRDRVRAVRVSVSAIWNGDPDHPQFRWRLDGSEAMPAYKLAYYRHMELGVALYPAICAQWRQLVSKKDITETPGNYLSIVSLVLKHQFP